MAKWRVYNTHKDGLTHKEDFRGDKIEIPAGKYILMDYEDAVLFKGQYFPMKFDAMDQQTPQSMKMIRIEPDSDADTMVLKTKFICQRDGTEFGSQAELDAYTKGKFGEEVFKDDALEEEVAKKKSKKTG